MKYTKHMTLKEWNKFHKILKDSKGNFVPPGNDFQYRNYFTGKEESLETVTAQEVLLSKYKIIIEEFEPKWTRKYHKITKYVNMKNFVKALIILDKSVQTLSKNTIVEKNNKKTKRKRKTFDVRNSQRIRRTNNNDCNERSFSKWLLWGDNSQ